MAAPRISPGHQKDLEHSADKGLVLGTLGNSGSMSESAQSPSVNFHSLSWMLNGSFIPSPHPLFHTTDAVKWMGLKTRETRLFCQCTIIWERTTKGQWGCFTELSQRSAFQVVVVLYPQAHSLSFPQCNPCSLFRMESYIALCMALWYVVPPFSSQKRHMQWGGEKELLDGSDRNIRRPFFRMFWRKKSPYGATTIYLFHTKCCWVYVVFFWFFS